MTHRYTYMDEYSEPTGWGRWVGAEREPIAFGADADIASGRNLNRLQPRLNTLGHCAGQSASRNGVPKADLGNQRFDTMFSAFDGPTQMLARISYLGASKRSSKKQTVSRVGRRQPKGLRRHTPIERECAIVTLWCRVSLGRMGGSGAGTHHFWDQIGSISLCIEWRLPLRSEYSFPGYGAVSRPAIFSVPGRHGRETVPQLNGNGSFRLSFNPHRRRGGPAGSRPEHSLHG